MSDTDHTRRRILAFGTVALLPACLSLDAGESESESSPTPSPSPTSSPTPEETPTETPESSPTPCEQPTPEPVPDVAIKNSREETATAEVTITKLTEDGEDGEIVHEEKLTLDPDEGVERFDVLPGLATYRCSVEVEDGPSGTEEIETEPDRRSMITIRIKDEGTVDIGLLHVQTPATPTACP